jgi:hypothetical protein
MHRTHSRCRHAEAGAARADGPNAELTEDTGTKNSEFAKDILGHTQTGSANLTTTTIVLGFS